MKKGLIVFILSTIFLIALVSAQVSTSTSQGTVVSSSLADLWNLILGIIIWLGRYILFGAAYAFGFSASQTVAIILAIIIWAAMLWEMTKALRDFTAFSAPVAFIISAAIMMIITLLGVIRLLALALASLIATITSSNGKAIALGILFVILVYIIIRLIMAKLGYSFKKQKQGIRKAKEEAGRKGLEKIGEEFKG